MTLLYWYLGSQQSYISGNDAMPARTFFALVAESPKVLQNSKREFICRFWIPLLL